MGEQQTAVLVGRSGKTYSYGVYALGTSWHKTGGNYAFAKRGVRWVWEPVYIGETDDLSTRLPNHEKWPCALWYQATHILARVNNDSVARLTEEADLRNSYYPPCNEQ